MGGKTAIVLGLAVGVTAGALLVGGAVMLVPASKLPGALAAPSSPATQPLPASPSAPVTATPAASTTPATNPSAGASPSGADAAFGVGAAAPALVLPKLGGGTIDLAALRGKPVWVNFVASWCPSCQDELPRMNGFAARYAEQGLSVVLVDVREDEATVEAFRKGVGTALPTALDANGTAQDAWGALALPVHFWVDAEGIVRAGALGGIGPDVMAQNLQTILPGVTVTP